MECNRVLSILMQEELTEVLAPCEVDGMAHPVVLGLSGKAKALSVSYSLPNAG